MKIVTQFQSRIQSLIIYKIRAHLGIHGNEIANKFAKDGRHLIHSLPFLPYKHAHSTPYFLHKDKWKGNMARIPFKGPIRNI